MLDFIKDNWKLLVVVVLMLVNLLILILKKYKKVDNVWSYILSIIPDLINQVEAPGNGADKLTAVLGIIVGLLKDNFGMSEGAILTYLPKVQEFIEKVLSTPQKKGEKNG